MRSQWEWGSGLGSSSLAEDLHKRGFVPQQPLAGLLWPRWALQHHKGSRRERLSLCRSGGHEPLGSVAGAGCNVRESEGQMGICHML